MSEETQSKPRPVLSVRFPVLFILLACSGVTVGILLCTLLFLVSPGVSDTAAAWVLLVAIFSAWHSARWMETPSRRALGIWMTVVAAALPLSLYVYETLPHERQKTTKPPAQYYIPKEERDRIYQQFLLDTR